MTILAIVILIFLLIVSIIDFKLKCVPSIFLTGFLFVVVILNPTTVWFGILGLIISLLMFEGKIFEGVADIKVMTMLSVMMASVNQLFMLIVLVLFYGIVWKAMWRYKFWIKKKKIPREFPFLPVFLFVYLTFLILGIIV